MESPSITLILTSLEQTKALGLRIAELLKAGDVIGLIGDLGAGKTHLTKAIAEGLQVLAEQVSSPTFTLIHEYAGRLPLRHCDAYRLRRPEEFADLGLDDLFDEQGVAIVEWADRVIHDLPRDHLQFTLTVTGLHERQLSLAGQGPRSKELARDIYQQWITQGQEEDSGH